MDNTPLETDILKNFGGISCNNLNDILRTCEDSDDEIKTFDHSPYYDSSNIQSALLQNDDKFSIFSINIQSLNAKFDKLVSFLHGLHEDNFDFSAICIQETWLSQEDDISMFELPGYHLISQGKLCCGHGGLIVYLQDKFTYKLRKMYDTSEIWEGLFIDIEGGNMENKITLANIYRPPKRNNCNSTIEAFIQEFKPIVHALGQENSTALFAGDFNIDLLKIDERQKFQEYFDLFVTLGFYPKLTLPTRFSRRNCTLIDQIFCRFARSTQMSTSGIFFSNMSDHLPYFIYFDMNTIKKPVPKTVKVNTYDANSINAFCENVRSVITQNPLNVNLLADPNSNYNFLEKTLQESREKYLPSKFVKFNKYKHKLSPWVTSDILRSIKFKDKLYKKLKITKQDSPNYNKLSTNLHTYQAILNKNIRMAKALYYTERFDKFRNDIKKTWSTIKGILHKSNGKKEFPKFFKHNDTKIFDDQAVANHFNYFFANIGPKLSQSIEYDGNKNVDTYLETKIMSTFNFETVTGDDIMKITKEIAPKTSCGHDNLSTKLLKQVAPYISLTLALILNQSLNTGIFPDKLKIAKIVPLFKKGDEHVFDNYRPISLLPSISKIFEKVVCKQLYQYFVDNKLFYDSQYGFRKGHSTEMASLEFTDRVLHDLDKDKVPISVFLDLSKAFDTLNHSILLHKLEHYGIKGIALQWFQSYLYNRKQFVDYNGTFSTMSSISTGVPQGSVLGPLLFIIYINDIKDACDKFHAIIFADDSNLLDSLCSFDVSAARNVYNKHLLSKNINTELALVHEWLIINKLSLNIKKTTFMIFHHRQRNIANFIPVITISNHTISRVESFDFLGLTLDQHLNWHPHIQKIANKVSRTLGVMNRLKRLHQCTY